MANYLLLYHGGSMPETQDEQAKVMAISAGGSVSTDASGPSGYSIIKADSLDAAVALAKGCPVLQGGASVQVVETFDVM